MSNLEKVISSLAADCKPSAPMLHPAWAVALWLGLSCSVSLLLILMIDLREDLALQMTQGLFWTEVITLTTLVISCCISAVWFSFPDMRQQRRVVFIPLPILLFYISLLIYRLRVPETTLPPHGEIHELTCSLCVTLFALIPGISIFLIMRRYATAHPRIAGALGLLASASIGQLALKFAEASDSVPHLLVWHVLPIIALGLVGSWLGQKFLSW